MAEASAYYNAKQRCTNPRNPKWKDYGGRGIEFRFRSFEQFFAEIGPRPKGMVLDRKDNDGHYEPGNVRWVTRHESNCNRRYDTKAVRHHQSVAGRKAGLASAAAMRKKPKQLFKDRQRAGILANHLHWHVRRGISNRECALCAH